METVEITNEHVTIMRDKYNCQDLTDKDIVEAMVKWDEMTRNGKNIIVHLSFPSFQSVLNFIKRKK